ncbi:hypothetical protein BU15DRAFT_62600 [Melanogaster broomeanus]|nr:hypothetical protein BU15DRAFT_62600 [Melanogaster broomeanus]
MHTDMDQEIMVPKPPPFPSQQVPGKDTAMFVNHHCHMLSITICYEVKHVEVPMLGTWIKWHGCEWHLSPPGPTTKHIWNGTTDQPHDSELPGVLIELSPAWFQQGCDGLNNSQQGRNHLPEVLALLKASNSLSTRAWAWLHDPISAALGSTASWMALMDDKDVL